MDWRNALQAASNEAAGTIAGPVDLIALALRAAGVPVPQDPVMGSEWLKQRGLMADVRPGTSQVLGATAGLLAPTAMIAKAPQIASGLLKGADNLSAPRTLNQQTGAIVWHGSPHKFDKFDSSKIGTGEGAQAYGHGLYLADSPKVAKSYAEQLSTASGPAGDVAKYWRANGGEKAYRAFAKDAGLKAEEIEPVANAIRDSGSLYKVDLPDDKIAKMLDWDKPLSEQAPEVREAVEALMSQRGPLDDPRTWGWKNPGKVTGRDAYEVLSRGSQAKPGLGAPSATDAFRGAGIPGIRYLDGGSRSAGAGSRNYVVFPGEEDALRILERNGQGLLDEAAKPAGLMTDGARRMEIAQRNAAKPVSEGGLGLGPNNTAAERAKAMGFDTPAYHATTSDVQAFDISKSSPSAAFGPGAYVTSSPLDASHWAKSAEGANVMPLLANKSNVLPMKPLSEKDAKKLSELLGREINANDAVPYLSLERRHGGVSSGASKAGFSGVDHAGPGAGYEHTVFTDPSQLRSRFAAFDPARRNESDLLGGADPYLLSLLGLGAGGLLYAGQK